MNDIIFQLGFLMLILLGALSFTLFIRRLLINTSSRVQLMRETDQKLDRIIEMLEQQAKQK